MQIDMSQPTQKKPKLLYVPDGSDGPLVKAPLSLTDLPFEIRQEVYSYLCQNLCIVLRREGAWSVEDDRWNETITLYREGDWALNFLQTCKTIRVELRVCLLRETILFKVESDRNHEWWKLKQYDHERFGTIAKTIPELFRTCVNEIWYANSNWRGGYDDYRSIFPRLSCTHFEPVVVPRGKSTYSANNVRNIVLAWFDNRHRFRHPRGKIADANYSGLDVLNVTMWLFDGKQDPSIGWQAVLDLTSRTVTILKKARFTKIPFDEKSSIEKGATMDELEFLRDEWYVSSDAWKCEDIEKGA